MSLFDHAPDQEYGKWGFIDIAVETFADVMESLGTAWNNQKAPSGAFIFQA